MKGPARRFDYDEAARRYRAGNRVADIAEDFGVSQSAIRRAVNPEARERSDRHAAAWSMSAVCVDCGKPTSVYNKNGGGRRAEPRCTACAGKLRRTSVRPDALYCLGCDEWKPDHAFRRNSHLASRRGRGRLCRACDTAAKRAYRDSRKEPCSHGCGRLADTVARRDPTKPLECQQCYRDRVSTRNARA